MSLLSRIGAAYDAATAQELLTLGLQASAAATPLSNPSPWLLDAFGGRPSAAGKVVTPETSMRVAAVYACVRVLSQSIGQLPFVMYRKTADGMEPATDHPLYSLLASQPNAEMTAQDCTEMAMGHLCLRGNTYRQIVRRGGQVSEIIPLNPDWVIMHRDDAGNLIYDYQQPYSSQVTFKSTEIWRTIGMTHNGIQGLSPLSYAREAIGLSLATEEHGAKLFSNGAQPALALESPGVMSEEAYDRLKASTHEEYGGSSNSWKTMILEDGVKVSRLSMTAVDSQFIEGRRFQLEEICRFYNVPPHKVQELSRSTFNNIEHLTMDFKNSSLAPWMVRFEQTASRDLLLPNERGKYIFRFDTSQLDRGDTAALVNLIASGIANTWLSPNEARAMFNLNPREGGDKYENPNTSTGKTPPGVPVPDPQAA